MKREIAMRKSAYPRWVASNKMTYDKSEHEIAAMEAVLETLENVSHAIQTGKIVG